MYGYPSLHTVMSERTVFYGSREPFAMTFDRSQRRTEPSNPPVANSLPSPENAID